jgi:hypothetical protein
MPRVVLQMAVAKLDDVFGWGLTALDFVMVLREVMNLQDNRRRG